MRKSAAHPTHYLAEFSECRSEWLSDPLRAREELSRLFIESGEFIRAEYFSASENAVLSGSLIGQSAELSFHAWPQSAFATCGLFITDGNLNPRKFLNRVNRLVKAKRYLVLEVPVGEILSGEE